jgi:hypothetical protein
MHHFITNALKSFANTISKIIYIFHKGINVFKAVLLSLLRNYSISCLVT